MQSRYSMTPQLNNDNSSKTSWTNTTGYNSTCPKVAGKWLNLPAGRQVKFCALIKVSVWLKVKYFDPDSYLDANFLQLQNVSANLKNWFSFFKVLILKKCKNE